MEDLTKLSTEELLARKKAGRARLMGQAKLIVTVIEELNQRGLGANAINVFQILSEGDGSPEHTELMRREDGREALKAWVKSGSL